VGDHRGRGPVPVSLDFAPAAGLCPSCGHGWAWYDYDDGVERCRHRMADEQECGCPMDFFDAGRAETLRAWREDASPDVSRR
jgi:hypothetical protein